MFVTGPCCKTMSRINVFCAEARLQPRTSEARNPEDTREFSSTKHPVVRPCSVVTGVQYRGIKRPDREFNYSSPSIAEYKNGRSYVLASPTCFHGANRVKVYLFTFENR